MITYFEYDETFTYIGITKRETEYEPFPIASTRIVAPDLNAGEYAVFTGDDWKVVTDRPVKPVIIPQVVTMRQARLALLSQGILNDVDVALQALADPDKSGAIIEWEYSQTVERNRPFVALLGAALALSDAQLDDLFILAVAL